MPVLTLLQVDYLTLQNISHNTVNLCFNGVKKKSQFNYLSFC